MAYRSWEYNGVEFNPGDRVKVVRLEHDAAPNGMGSGIQWDNNWIGREKDADGNTVVDGMDGAIGHEFVINTIDERGVIFTDFVEQELDFEPSLYAYPLSVLEKMPTTAH